MLFEGLYKMFESPFVIISFFSGVLYIIMGVVLYYFPSKNVSYLYGYRSGNSMSSQERWAFSQKYSAKVMMCLGGVLMCFSLFGVCVDFGRGINVVLGISLLILSCVILRIITEKAINQKFGKIK